MTTFNFNEKLTKEEQAELNKKIETDPAIIKLQKKKEELEKKLSQLDEQIKDQKPMAAERLRRKRAHRLIELGGLVEKYMGEVNKNDFSWYALDYYLPLIFKELDKPETKAKIERHMEKQTKPKKINEVTEPKTPENV